MQYYKVNIIGDEHGGKTSWLNKLLKKDFNFRYIPTRDVQVDPIQIKTHSNKLVGYNIWDCAGDYRYQGEGDVYYKNSDACIVMFSFDSIESFENIPYWVHKYRNICPNSYIILVGNKCEYHDNISPIYIQKVIKKLKIDYCSISVKNNYNCMLPLNMITRVVNKNSNFIQSYL